MVVVGGDVDSTGPPTGDLLLVRSGGTHRLDTSPVMPVALGVSSCLASRPARPPVTHGPGVGVSLAVWRFQEVTACVSTHALRPVLGRIAGCLRFQGLQAMNDPHVVSLTYKMSHIGNVDYSTARPLTADDPAG